MVEQHHLSDLLGLWLDRNLEYNLKRDETLIWGARYGCLDIVRQLLKSGADIHAGGDFALQIACEVGHLEVVQFLLAAGANVQAADNRPLRLAARFGHLEIARALLNAGADIHAWDDMALQWAVYGNHVEMVKFLLASGAVVNSRDTIRRALSHGYHDIVTLLEERSCLHPVTISLSPINGTSVQL